MRKVLRITAVKEGSQAAELGIEAGDVLVSYNGRPISSNVEFSNAVHTADEGKMEKRTVVFERKGQFQEVSVVEGGLGIQCSEEVDHSVGASQVQAEKVLSESPYGLTRIVAMVVSFFGWLLVLLGLIATVMGLADGANSRMGVVTFLKVLPGLGTAVGGFLLVMGAQVTKATVDNSDQTREMLRLMSNR